MYQKLDLLESDKSVKRNIKSRTGNKNEFREKALNLKRIILMVIEILDMVDITMMVDG